MWNYVIFPTEMILGLSPYLIFAALVLYIGVRAALLQGGIYYAVQKTRLVTKRVYGIPWAEGQLKKEFAATIWIILFDALLITLIIKADLFGHWPESWSAFTLTFAIAFIWFEIWFYVSHRILHHRKFYWLHAQHHTARVTSPMTALSFSLAERTLLLAGGLLVPAVLSHMLPFSVKALAIYLLFNYLLNLYAHSNVELIPPRWLDRKLGQFFNATTYHALHHARYQGHYGLFTPFMDRWCKTVFADYREVQRRAAGGENLKSFNQKFLSDHQERGAL